MSKLFRSEYLSLENDKVMTLGILEKFAQSIQCVKFYTVMVEETYLKPRASGYMYHMGG